MIVNRKSITLINLMIYISKLSTNNKHQKHKIDNFRYLINISE